MLSSKDTVKETFKELIENYKAIVLEDGNEGELYKWECIKHYQQHFDLEANDFEESLREALKKKRNLLYQISGGFIHRAVEYFPEKVQGMFAILYNEELPLKERIDRFQELSEGLVEPIAEEHGKRLKHQQDERTLSFYLSMQYPDWYPYYMDGVYQVFIKLLPNETTRPAGEKYYHFIELGKEVLPLIQNDKELLEMVNNTLHKKCYRGEQKWVIFQDILWRNKQLMELEPITAGNILKAADKIDEQGVPEDVLNKENIYWIEVRGKEFLFSEIDRLAQIEANGKFEPRKDIKLTATLYKVKYSLSINDYRQGINFFKKNELDFFHMIKGMPYHSKEKESRLRNLKLYPLVRKLLVWGKETASVLNGFRFKSNVHRTGLGKFRSYIWGRIYKKKDGDKKIFFTIDVNAENLNLVIKLDCMRSGSNALSEQQIEKFDSLVKTKKPLRVIEKDELEFYDWKSLLQLTKDFIKEFEWLYEECIESVHKNTPLLGHTNGEITLGNPSKAGNIKSKIRNRKRTFKGLDIDFGKLRRNRKRTGDSGEEIVIQSEIQKLKKAGKYDLANKVKAKKDGEGYDILSYDVNGNEIHIEVKTTRGSKNSPFYISINEFEYAKRNKGKYIIYRLYNFKSPYNKIGYFKVTAEKLINDYVLEGINFEVSSRSYSN